MRVERLQDEGDEDDGEVPDVVVVDQDEPAQCEVDVVLLSSRDVLNTKLFHPFDKPMNSFQNFLDVALL